MKMNRITIMGVLAALAMIMAPGFTAQAASLDGSPDQSVDLSTTADDIDTPDTEVEDNVAHVGDIKTPKVEAPEVKTPELGE